MREEPLGRISESEVKQAVLAGQVIKEYPEDTPYPSILILGFTSNRRALHVVAAHDPESDHGVVITVYEPTPELWFELKVRKR